MPDEENELDRLRFVEVIAQRLPLRVGQVLPLVPGVDGTQQRAFALGPAGRR